MIKTLYLFPAADGRSWFLSLSRLWESMDFLHCSLPLPLFVILSEVRRQTNAVEGPLGENPSPSTNRHSLPTILLMQSSATSMLAILSVGRCPTLSSRLLRRRVGGKQAAPPLHFPTR